MPIQAITSIVFILIALAGTYLFLKSHFSAAMVLTWQRPRLGGFFSELLRADVRGNAKKISAYQVMALLMAVYAIVIGALFPASPVQSIEIANGLATLWNPLVLLFCQAVWLVVFLITGRSSITSSTLSFSVRHDRI